MAEAADVQIVILAAGLSRRWGADNKLLHPIAGRPMLSAAVDAAKEASVIPPIVIVSAAITSGLQLPGISYIENPSPADGLASSLAIGVSAAAALPCNWALIMLGDMPFVTPQTLATMIAAGADDCDVVMCRSDRQQPPVLWHRRHFQRLMQQRGDQGGKALLSDKTLRIRYINVPAGELRDIDTEADIAPL